MLVLDFCRSFSPGVLEALSTQVFELMSCDVSKIIADKASEMKIPDLTGLLQMGSGD